MPRRAAWSILRSGSNTPLRDVDRVIAAREIDERDGGFLRKLVGVEVRRRATLRAIVRHVTHGRASPDLAAHLHIAFVQMFFLDRIPDHALRAECLDGVRRTLGGSKVRLAREALLAAFELRQNGHVHDPRRDLEQRNLHLRDAVFHDPAEHPLLWAEDALSMPAALLKRWSARFGEEKAFALARLALEEAPLSIRVVRGERASVASELEAVGVATRPGVHASILLASSDTAAALTASEAFTQGRITVQGETALRAAEAVGAREGETIADLCAAPGGKTAVLAQSGAKLVACDVSAAKLERVASTLERLGLRERVELVETSFGEALGAREFDAVLVDAPCSNTGVLAQRPEARWRYGPATKAELVKIQTQLIDRAAQLVRPGGRVVWSTCALEPDENQRAVQGFLARHPNFVLDAERELTPDVDTRAEVGSGPVDGGYHARLVRRD
jgi:16S rRNA (cytosine967-C5)-methyltransferase